MSKDFEYKNYFENKNITKQGFGILGRGLGVAQFLLKNGANVLITDNKEESFFNKQIEELRVWMDKNKIDKERVKFVFGEHKLEDFINCDYVIQASGVPKNNIYLEAAKNNNIPVYQESSLFLKIIRDFNKNLPKEEKVKIVAITGTRGKTTTTYLIHKILKDYFETKLKDRKIYLGGNIQGISTIEILEKIQPKDIVVAEADSWLLQGFEDIKFGPDIAVFTNLMRDHMNYYKDNMSEYFTDKAQIFLYQKREDIFISTDEFPELVNKYLKKEFVSMYNNLDSNRIFIKKEEIDSDKNLFKSPLIGEHNRINISLAIRASQSLSVKEKNIKESINDFSGVPGRLEFVKEKNGVKYYNDTTATTGEATIAAINAFRDKEEIILITGGRDKDLEIEDYVKKMILEKQNKKIKKIILLNDITTTGTEKVLKKFQELNFSDFILASSVNEAVKLSKEDIKKGDVILFSPGFASFGMFLNEYERGERFLEAI